MFFESCVHIPLNRLAIDRDVLQNVLLDRPAKEVELTDSRHKLLMAACLKQDALPSAKRVKKTFGIRIQFALIVEIDKELALPHKIRRIVLLGVVCDEVIHKSKTYGGLALQNRHESIEMSRMHVELLQPSNDQILFALNT